MAVTLGSAGNLLAQGVHYRHHTEMPPGAIGSAQLQRGGPLAGYFQPVEIKAPEGAEISLAVNNQFLEPQPAPVEAGLLVGGVYRFRVSGIPHEEGREVFPTLEIIDRLYPPGGQERRFPIVVEITQEDLEFALSGRYVTRVIYLEEPHAALPVNEEDIGGPNSFDAKPGDNALEVADTLGRPMAILRLGAWLPIRNQANGPIDMGLESPLGTTLPLIRFHRGLRDQALYYEQDVPPGAGDAQPLPSDCEPAASRIPAALPIGALPRMRTASHEQPALGTRVNWRGR